MRKLILFFMVCLPGFLFAEEKSVAQIGHASSTPGVAGFMQMFIGLFFVLLVIAAVVLFMRRFGSFTHLNRNHIRVIAGLSVGQRERIMLLQVAEQQLLVGIAPGSIRTLHVLDKPVEESMADNTAPTPGGFAEKLQSLLQKKS